MNEDGARRLALVRAIESEDAAEAMLTRDDRLYATGAALAEAGGPGSGHNPRRRDDLFLQRRSSLAFDRLASRFPAVAQAERRSRWPTWLDWTIPLAALVLGVASNAIDGKRLSIIAFPMLGMLLWNFAVYVSLAGRFLFRFGPSRHIPRRHLLGGLIERIGGPGRSAASAQPQLGSAIARGLRDWLSWSAPLTNSRAARLLHISAAAIAAGLLLGMYWRALGTEYRAGWESTLLGPGAVHGLVHFMLWPASLVTGIALPDPAEVQSLRWGVGAVQGENAGRWLHLYAATAFLFIIGPRLALATFNALRAARLKRHFPIPGKEDFYVRRLLRSLGDEAVVVRIIPYSFHPPEETRRQLDRLLGDVLGEKTRTMIEPTIDYGDEDEWLARNLETGDADHLIVLFNLSTTPESENHGALVAGLRRQIAGAKSGAGLIVLLDESAMRQRLGDTADARVESRRAAWEAVLRQHHAAPLFLDLGAETATLARPLEAALLHGQGDTPE